MDTPTPETLRDFIHHELQRARLTRSSEEAIIIEEAMGNRIADAWKVEHDELLDWRQNGEDLTLWGDLTTLKAHIGVLERVRRIAEEINRATHAAIYFQRSYEPCPHGNLPIYPTHGRWCDGCWGELEEALAALAGKEVVLRNGPAWSPPIVNPGFDTDVGGADVFKSWVEETGAVGVEATWRPVRFSQSMTCPLCHETFEIIVTANVRGAAWVDDLSAVVPSAAIAEDEPKRLLPWDEYVKKVRADLARKGQDDDQ